jgi:gluconokinase
VTPHILIVMGVSGCGKTTVGRELAARLGWPFQEGDDFHPPANVARMRDGIPLSDADRAPWLTAITRWASTEVSAARSAVVTCSALKRSYRDQLRTAGPGVTFVYLQVPRDELERRVSHRHHEFMPASLLVSQLATLEEPAGDEPHVLIVDAAGPIETTVETALQAIRRAGIGGPVSGP